MVRLAICAVPLILGASALAQEAPRPPAVPGLPPALAEGGDAAWSAPVLPGIAGGPAVAGPGGVPAARDDAPAAAGTAGAVETDLVGMVLKAHPVVQAVMAVLALSVAAVLTVLFFKTAEFLLAFARLRRSRAMLARNTGLFAVPGDCPLARSTAAACDEVASLPDCLTAALRGSSRERLDIRLDRIEAGAVRRLRSGTGLLASIGAIGPFIGLFGTVFGIMNSFLAIAGSRTTHLAVVAPGIAEALLATGIGLVAAIPAVLVYNAIIRRIAAFRSGLADGRADLLLRFSRELDRRMGA
jgi:biopolymer transport protein ExbB